MAEKFMTRRERREAERRQADAAYDAQQAAKAERSDDQQAPEAELLARDPAVRVRRTRRGRSTCQARSAGPARAASAARSTGEAGCTGPVGAGRTGSARARRTSRSHGASDGTSCAHRSSRGGRADGTPALRDPR